MGLPMLDPRSDLYDRIYTALCTARDRGGEILHLSERPGPIEDGPDHDATFTVTFRIPCAKPHMNDKAAQG